MIHCQRCTPDELDTLVPLFDQYMQFYKQPSAPEKYHQYLQSRLANEDAVIYLAFDDEQRAVGFVLHYFSFSSVSQAPVIILNDLFVAPETRQQGIASALVACSQALAKERGAARISLATAADNLQAQALYEKHGFIRDQHFYHYNLSA